MPEGFSDHAAGLHGEHHIVSASALLFAWDVLRCIKYNISQIVETGILVLKDCLGGVLCVFLSFFLKIIFIAKKNSV